MEEDEILMLEVKSGNLDSLVPLFDKYHARLYNFFLRLTRSRETSEDLTQNVFSRIIAYRNSFNEEYKFKAWMYQMARNVHIDHHHKNKMLVPDSDENFLYRHDIQKTKSEAETKQNYDTLTDALELLDPHDREIIELSKFQDLSYADISEITGNSVGAIKVKVHRAINKLREIYFQLA